MTEQEQTIYDLVSLGIRGDALSIRQLARRLLRAAPRTEEGQPFYIALTRLLAQPTSVAARTPAIAFGDAGALLRVDHAPVRRPPELADAKQQILRAIVAERAAALQLSRAALEPTKTLLLTGPPGVGKTMTATYLAAALELPLVTLDLAGLISSFLGRTGQNIRQALDAARATPCVLLLDEFDAIAKRRDDPSDVGELKRIVNVLLLELETWPAHGLLVAATNHAELLDRAIWRRFDRVLQLEMPDAGSREALLRRTLDEMGFVVGDGLVRLCAQAARGLSGSDIVRHTRTAGRATILGGESEIAPRLIDFALEHLRTRTSDDSDMRAVFARLAVDGAGLSHRRVAELLGVSHPTVGRLLKRSREQEDQHHRVSSPPVHSATSR